MTDEEFKKWENKTFGYGYGTGEIHTLAVLKKFLEVCPSSGNYDYKIIEKSVGKEQCWLILTLLLQNTDIIEYGSSPRYGWLTDRGIELKLFLEAKTVDELYYLINGKGEDE